MNEEKSIGKERVVILICELYENNRTSVIEYPNFKRYFTDSDPLLNTSHRLPKKDLYQDPEAIVSYLKSLPVEFRKSQEGSTTNLYNILYRHYREAIDAVGVLEQRIGSLDSLKGLDEQSIAFLAYNNKRMFSPDAEHLITKTFGSLENSAKKHKELFNIQPSLEVIKQNKEKITELFPELKKEKNENLNKYKPA